MSWVLVGGDSDHTCEFHCLDYYFKKKKSLCTNNFVHIVYLLVITYSSIRKLNHIFHLERERERERCVS